MTLKININADKLNTNERRLKAQLVANEMQIILNSPEFKNNLLAIKDYYGELSKYKDYTITEIYNHIMSGSETLSPEIDNEIDLIVDDYYTPKRVVGYTYEKYPTIYSNTKYFDSVSSKYVGSNYLHEYGHKLGFDHDFKSTDRRQYSLCYILNDVYELTWDQIFGTASPSDKILVCRRTWYGLKKCRWLNVRYGKN